MATKANMKNDGMPHINWHRKTTRVLATGRQPSSFRKHRVFSVAGVTNAGGAGGLGSKYCSHQRVRLPFGKHALHVSHNNKKQADNVIANCRKMLRSTMKKAGK
jgi:hypothetical protein